MRVTSILLAGVLAFVANAQDATTTDAAPTTTDPALAAQNSAQAAMIACIEACQAGDVDCTSKCIAVPNPDESHVNATNACVAECPQGNGSEADNLAYRQCVEGCIGEHYFTASAGTPQATGGAGSGGANGGGNDEGDGNDGADGGNDDASNTEGEQSSPTATGAPSETNAAAGLGVAGSAAGLVGFLAAVLAL